MAKGVIRCSVQYPNGTDFVNKYHLGKGGYVQQTIDSDVLKFLQKYTPRRSAQGTTLMTSAYSHTTIGSGEINYPGPYAHFQYVGYVRTTEDGRVFARKDEAKPILTKRELSHEKSKNPNATKEWFETMKKNHTQDILESAKRAAKRGKP